jgi:hypothetical protein
MHATRAVLPVSSCLACLALTVLIGLAPTVARAEVVKGKVVSNALPVAGARVGLYVDQSKGFQGDPAYRSEPTSAAGEFRIEVPPGQYYLIASTVAEGRSRPGPGDYFAYYGGNPVMLDAGEEIDISVSVNPVIDVGQRRVAGGTGIRGRVFADGKPLDRARVILYQDAGTIFRGMGYASTFTTATGDFSFNLEPGTYYVLARKRAGEDRFGPLVAGDLFAYASDNPVEVTDGAFTMISMNAITKLEKPKTGGPELSLGGTMKGGETSIEGTVRDEGGKPVAGIYVSAFRDSMMTAKPDFIARTGPDGRYTLNLSGGGEYFIGARNTLGGPAEKGDLLGRYDGNEDHSVVLKSGEKRGAIDIVVEKVP